MKKYLGISFKISILICVVTLLSSCGGGKSLSFDDKIKLDYEKNHRLNKYYELKEKYDNRVVLWLNSDSDCYWITNFSLWLVFCVLPDLPEIAACGGIVAIFYLVAWWIGVTLCGGGILAVLAWLGTMFFVIPGVPPAIIGVVYLCSMFGVLKHICELFI